MLNPNKKNFIYINSIIFQIGLTSAAFSLFLASYNMLLISEIIHASLVSLKDKDAKNVFLLEYPFFLMINITANRFPLFSFGGTVLDNLFGFRM
ncbi:MAG: hypothetical protein MJ252_29650 [archaeon]|nr:hypothetical protein [archaeon]